MDTNHPTYNKIDNTFNRIMNEIDKFEKVFKQGGQLEMAVMEIDGDPSYLKDVAQALAGLYDALEDAHFGTIGHVVDDRGAKDDVHPAHQESVQENKKTIKEGVLDSDDEDGFMARSQLYFMARDAIKLHSVIQDQDDLEPWVQSKIAQSSKDMDAVRRYTEYNAMKAEVEPEGMELNTHSHPEESTIEENLQKAEEEIKELKTDTPKEEVAEGMDFDAKRDDGLQVIAKDMFKHALANAKKKHKESKVAEGVTISGAIPTSGNPHKDQTTTFIPTKVVDKTSPVTSVPDIPSPPKPKKPKKKIDKKKKNHAKKKPKVTLPTDGGFASGSKAGKATAVTMQEVKV
jgi:hypothetical protein